MSIKYGYSESVAQRGDDHQSQRQATFETDACAEDVHNDRPINNGPAESLKTDLGKKKLILIPEEKHPRGALALIEHCQSCQRRVAIVAIVYEDHAAA